ncbi:MAG: hypothetical protein B7Z26_04650, partial [Asticcacaulis sp. 32-58-5]
MRRLYGAAERLDGPLVLKRIDGRRHVVGALDDQARRLGVQRGMALAQARSRVSGLVVREMDAAADQAGLDDLARWALKRYSPIAAADAPDGVVFDIAGADHLYGGEQALVSHALAALAAMEVAAYAAVADTWGGAHALVRYSGRSVTIVEPGKTIDA